MSDHQGDFIEKVRKFSRWELGLEEPKKEEQPLHVTFIDGCHCAFCAAYLTALRAKGTG